MKLLVALAFLSTICGSQAVADISTILAPRSLPISPAVIDYAATCNGTYGTKCGNCSTMLFCLGPTAPVLNKCPTDMPYCDATSNRCVAWKPTGCPEAECDGPCPNKFLCLEPEGFFPHPSDCNQYFECYHSESIKYDCPPNHSWDTDGMGCKERRLVADCGTITCKTTDLYAPLSNNATFFGYCNVDAIEATDGVLVSKCSSNLEKFDNIRRECVFQCPAEGFYQHQQRPSFYYECYKYGSQIFYRYKECSHNREFSDAEQRCIEPAGAVDRMGQSPGQKVL